MICVLNAAQEAGVSFQAVTLKAIENQSRFAGLSRSKLFEDRGKPDFSDQTKSLLTGSLDPIYSFIGGVSHVQLGIRQLDDPSSPAFDFVLPESPRLRLDPTAEVIPTNAVREIVRRGFKSRLKTVQRLTRVAPGRVVQFAPPPPVSDRSLQPLLEKISVKATTLPNRWLRLKLWRLTVDIFRQHAAEFGARFIDCPPEALDADGFMRDDLVQNTTHGNAAFGALVLGQIRALR
jgi:hypothetical protein